MQDFKRHIKEAITINSERLPLYAQLTNNKSIPLSRKLINYEKLLLSTAWMVDMVGDKYQKKGIPFIAEEFIEMSETPSFNVSFPEYINFNKKLVLVDFDPLLKKIKSGIRAKSSDKVVSACNYLLEELKIQPHVYCMTRHLIESMRRIAHLIPLHESKAQELSVSLPKFYSWTLIKAHLSFLSRSRKFDEQASFIQVAGIPFLWQDLPTIGTISSYDLAK